MLPVAWIDMVRQASLGPDPEEEAERLDHAAQSENVVYLRQLLLKREALFAVSTGRTADQGLLATFRNWLTPVVFKDTATETQYQLWKASASTSFTKFVHCWLLGLVATLWVSFATAGQSMQPLLIVSCVMEAILWIVPAILIWRQPFRPDVNTSLISMCATLSGSIIFASTVACTSYCSTPTCATMIETGMYSVQQYLVAFVFLLVHGISLSLQVRTLLIHMGVLYAVWFGLFIPRFAANLTTRLFGPLSQLLLLAVVAAQSYQYNVTSRLQFHMVVELALQIRANKDHLMEVQEAHVTAMKERVQAERARTTRDIHDAIMGYMCHQLRNPLHALLGILDQLRTRCVPPHAVDSTDVEYLDIAHSSTTQLAKVSDDVLEFQRLQNGSSIRRKDVADVTTVIVHAIAALGAQEFVDVSIGPDVPPSFESDSARVGQMLCIGLQNALKYRRTGTNVSLQCFKRKVDASLEGLQFEVHNEGDGLGTVDVAALFDPYTKLDSVASPSNSGAAAAASATHSQRLGLGLPISKLTAVLLNGQVGLEDRGRFTVYWFWIPVSATNTLDAARAGLQTPQAFARSTSTPFSQSSGMLVEYVSAITQEHPWTYWGRTIAMPRNAACNIMIVDDLKTNRRLLQAMLQRMGHSTVDLEDGDLILGKLEEGVTPDILLLDIHMVRTDGRDVTRLLREQGCTFPIIAVTGNVSLADIRSYYRTGFDGAMGKPFTSTHLKDLLNAACGVVE